MPEEKTERVKTIKAIKETNWLAVSVGIAIVISGLLMVLAFLAQAGTIDFEGTADVVFTDEGAPEGVIDMDNVRVMDVDGERITYYTLTDKSLSESEAQILLSYDGWSRRTLHIDKGYE